MAANPGLNPEEQGQLLALARSRLAAWLASGGGEPAGGETSGETDLPPALRQAAAAFVTLHAGLRLRGCIGTLTAGPPLARLVQDLVVAAASRDPRFQPVSAGELPGLHIEISVLSPPRTIDHLDAIQVGVHGLMVGRGPSRGVLLPQVAVEQRWDAATFLSQTCIKAGLDGEAWRPWQAGEDQHLQVQVFQAQVFSEPQARATA